MSSDGSKAAKAENFEGNNFKKVYDRHVETLSKLKSKVNTYHWIMSTLYSKIVCVSILILLINILTISTSSNGDNVVDTRDLVKGSALAVLDLDGLDQYHVVTDRICFINSAHCSIELVTFHKLIIDGFTTDCKK